MDTVLKNDAAPQATASRGGLWQRLGRANRLLLCTVVVPTALATLYFGVIASDVYVSESRFVVRSPQRQNHTSVIGTLLQGTGFSRAQDDTYPIIDYIESRDALRELNKDSYIVNAFGGRGDWFSRFPLIGSDSSFEALLRYYQKHVVQVDFDSASSISTLKVRAFTANDAQHINEVLLRLSEHLINRMNERASQDTIRFSQRQVDIAAAKAKNAAVALASYRNSHTVFDPEKQSALQLQQITSLRTQLLAAEAQLVQLRSIAPANPQVATLTTSIATMQKQIAAANDVVAGGKGSLSEKAASFARMQLDAQFADKELASAMASLEMARSEAQRQQLYLERIVQASKPDKAIEPRRLRSIIATLLVGLVAWGILTILIAGVKEHKD